MMQKSPIFETHLNDYLQQVARLDVTPLTQMLGVDVRDETVIIPFIGEKYRVGKNEILDPSGKRADYGVSVVLCKYLLLCPDNEPVSAQWQSFKDFKSAAPLISYFSDNVEEASKRLPRTTCQSRKCRRSHAGYVKTGRFYPCGSVC